MDYECGYSRQIIESYAPLLLPCPCCGANAQLGIKNTFLSGSTISFTVDVGCSNKDCFVRVTSIAMEQEEGIDQAIRTWNTRVPALYPCNPRLNLECTKEWCYINNGDCFLTPNIRYRRVDK